MEAQDKQLNPKAVWAEMPTTSGYFWRRVTLNDGTVYACKIERVLCIWKEFYFADENWNYMPNFRIHKTNLVTWNGPISPPAN